MDTIYSKDITLELKCRQSIAFMIQLVLYWLFHLVGNKGVCFRLRLIILIKRKFKFIYFILKEKYKNVKLYLKRVYFILQMSLVFGT